MEFQDILFLANSSVLFATEDGGTLRVIGDYNDYTEEDDDEDDEAEPEVVRMSFTLGFEMRPEELGGWDYDSDLCFCLIRVADADGGLWEAKSFFGSDSLLGVLEDNVHTYHLHSFADVPVSWKEALDSRPLLQGVRGYFDDRMYRHVHLGEAFYNVRFKYASPRFDVALAKSHSQAYLADLSRASPQEVDSAGESVVVKEATVDNATELRLEAFQRPVLIVRISGFFDNDVNEIPPFVHEIPCEKLMFHPQTRGLPVPLIFRKIGAAERPQAMVQYVPHSPLPTR